MEKITLTLTLEHYWLGYFFFYKMLSNRNGPMKYLCCFCPLLFKVFSASKFIKRKNWQCFHVKPPNNHTQLQQAYAVSLSLSLSLSVPLKQKISLNTINTAKNNKNVSSSNSKTTSNARRGHPNNNHTKQQTKISHSLQCQQYKLNAHIKKKVGI